MTNEKISTLEETALNLKALLTVLSTADSDNTQALAEMPTAVKIAAEMAETLYCAIADEHSRAIAEGGK